MPGQLPVDHRARALGRPVARADAGPAGGDDQPCARQRERRGAPTPPTAPRRARPPRRPPRSRRLQPLAAAGPERSSRSPAADRSDTTTTAATDGGDVCTRPRRTADETRPRPARGRRPVRGRNSDAAADAEQPRTSRSSRDAARALDSAGYAGPTTSHAARTAAGELPRNVRGAEGATLPGNLSGPCTATARQLWKADLLEGPTDGASRRAPTGGPAKLSGRAYPTA